MMLDFLLIHLASLSIGRLHVFHHLDVKQKQKIDLLRLVCLGMLEGTAANAETRL